jgi:hypothetical protein
VTGQKIEVMKVIGFDGWTVGAHHYQRLLEAFQARGLDLMLIHLGSWGNEPGRPAAETIKGLNVRDISFYSGSSFEEILRLEMPAAVIFLSTEAFAHRAFNRYCRRLNVPTVHLFHGLQQLMDTIPPTSTALRRIWLMRRHLLKSARYFWPAYARSLWDTNALLREWWRFAADIAIRARARRAKVAACDSRADRACVYIASEAGYAIETYGYPAEHVVAVGNPDLRAFGMPSGMVGDCLGRRLLTNRDVIYIDTALLDYGTVFYSPDEVVEHLATTADELRRQGKRLLLKPHPSTDPEIISAVRTRGIEVCSRADFVESLLRCCACITEPSTAALIPALLGMPLLLAQYGKVAGQRFGELIERYPRARSLGQLRDFSSILAAEHASLDPQRTREWIARNSGPLPAEEMPERVADAVASLAAASAPAWRRRMDGSDPHATHR